MQNLDWSEDSVMQALHHEQLGESEKALEFYDNAIELDPLNRQAL
jgi:tetratricopeptide (TPR) repeat protein